MKQVKIPKLKPEEKEEIIKNYFQKKEGDKRIATILNNVINAIMLAFLAVCNVIVAGVFFMVALKTKSSFAALMSVSAICTSIVISYAYVQAAKENHKRR